MVRYQKLWHAGTCLVRVFLQVDGVIVWSDLVDALLLQLLALSLMMFSELPNYIWPVRLSLDKLS